MTELPDHHWRVTKNFTDWDGQKIKAGTVADQMVKRGTVPGKQPFYNLITGNRVIAVTMGMPPVEPVLDHEAKEAAE